MQQSKTLEVTFSLRARATLDVDASRYQLAAPVLKLQLRGAGFPAAGLPLELNFASADADLKSQTLQLPGMVAAGRRRGTDRSAGRHEDPGRTELHRPAAAGRRAATHILQQLDVELPITRDHAVFGTFACSATVAASSKALMLSGLRLRLDDTTATGRAGISDLGTNALAFDLKLDRVNADRYLAPAAAAPAAGAAQPSPAAPTPIPVELIRSLNMHGSLSVGEAVFAGIQYHNLHVGVNAGGGRVRVFPSEAQMYGGQYHGDIGIDASGKLPRVSFDEHVSGVDFAPLFQDMFETRRVSGRGNGSIKASASGADSAALLRTLTGSLEFHVDHGAFEGADLWYEIRRARALLKQEPIPARTGPERTAFTALAATGRITNGVLASDDLLAALQYLQVRGHGTADIASGTVDYHLDATVLKIPGTAGEAAGAGDLSGYHGAGGGHGHIRCAESPARCDCPGQGTGAEGNREEKGRAQAAAAGQTAGQAQGAVRKLSPHAPCQGPTGTQR